MVNSTNGTGRGKQDPTQAVVLTLRKRPSVVRKSLRHGSVAARKSIPDLLTGDANNNDLPSGTTPQAVQANPWEDARPGPSRRSQTAPAGTLQHHLSFDHGSGVIMLPEDDDWLEEEDAESDSDEVVSSPRVVEDDEPAAASSIPGENSSPQDQTSPSRRRYGTYYHHPERRRLSQYVPGAFNPTD